MSGVEMREKGGGRREGAGDIWRYRAVEKKEDDSEERRRGLVLAFLCQVQAVRGAVGLGAPMPVDMQPHQGLYYYETSPNQPSRGSLDQKVWFSLLTYPVAIYRQSERYWEDAEVQVCPGPIVVDMALAQPSLLPYPLSLLPSLLMPPRLRVDSASL
ncbi:hypothetical protein FQA47_017679 [Oryzias melastigma]|uniref:Uncharacterized protein n=1 Tax=Oryzias melastigma TaxID=30732 RepID=A0A834FRE3_ORYME|nr:hypothetical protein FQA47_017679 [Oryzias melastigma]